VSLNFIYYPVSFILWCWHKVFGFVFGDASAAAWVLGIVFLTFTVRGIMFKPFVNQVRSMRKMQDFAPEVKKLQKKYANDKQRQAQEVQKLQKEHGVNPVGSCLPMLLQIPVLIGLNHVLRMFTNLPLDQKTENYFFTKTDVESYVNAKLFGVNLGEAIHNATIVGGTGGGWHWNVGVVAIPLMVIASIGTHLTARHSVARQNPAAATAQTALMAKVTLYLFPLGALVFGGLLPVGMLFYWVSTNGWTLMQQRLVYTRIDREEEVKKAEAIEKRNALGPKPGQKPQVGQKPSPQKKISSSSGQAGQGKNPKAGSPHQFAQQSGATPKDTRPESTKRSQSEKVNTGLVDGKTSTSKSEGKPTTAIEGSAQKNSTDAGARVPGSKNDSTNLTKKSGRKRR
jgi:YidC/Oxa1 family membrane protein insertase